MGSQFSEQLCSYCESKVWTNLPISQKGALRLLYHQQRVEPLWPARPQSWLLSSCWNRREKSVNPTWQLSVAEGTSSLSEQKHSVCSSLSQINRSPDNLLLCALALSSVSSTLGTCVRHVAVSVQTRWTSATLNRSFLWRKKQLRLKGGKRNKYWRWTNMWPWKKTIRLQNKFLIKKIVITPVDVSIIKTYFKTTAEP